jgi:glutamate-5-semialdehyde dehydrogenase
MDQCVDLIIPRGSNDFVRYIMNNTNIPVLGHADGICHVYVDNSADLDMAVKVVTDAKCQYVSVCNATETLLVHEQTASDFLPKLKKCLDQYHTEIRGCAKTQSIIKCKPATRDDWQTEYLDYTLSIMVVSSMNEAIDHINTFGSGHTDCIITQDMQKAKLFMNLIDSGNVFWNCSTRFSDGFRYGLGAEVGVSTNKIHARGPVGLEGLVIYKWKLLGQGQIAGDYTGTDSKQFTHISLNKECPV